MVQAGALVLVDDEHCVIVIRAYQSDEDDGRANRQRAAYVLCSEATSRDWFGGPRTGGKALLTRAFGEADRGDGADVYRA